MLLKPNIQIPKWDPLYLTNPYLLNAAIFDSSEEDMSAVAIDSSDHFRMFEFKIRTCPRGRSHDWTKCPYVHPGEKARRRDPRLFQYSGTECPDSRQGNNTCRKGDSCEFSHGVFESWLHPDRYRTQPCRDGISCRRRVCFFAHTSEQLRIPKIPGDELVSLMKNVQLGSGSGYGSPRVSTRNSGYGVEEEEPVMERVESGRDLRAKMYAKLMKDNSLERVRSYQPMISAGSWS